MSKNVVLRVAVAAAVVTGTIPGYAADECKDILRYAAQDTFRTTSSTSDNELSHYTLCSKTRNSSATGSSFQFNIPIPELKAIFGANLSDQAVRDKRTEYCNGTTVQTNRTSLDEVFKQSANADALNRWSECMAKKPLTCHVSRELQGAHFLVSVEWSPPHKAEDPVVQSSTVISATCPNAPARGTTIADRSAISFDCHRTGDAHAIISVVTSQGHVTCELPGAAQLSTPPAPLEERCADGHEPACLELEARADENAKECTARLSRASTTTPQDQIKKAMLERECGNPIANKISNRALIDNIRQTCDKHGSTSQDCKEARRAFLLNNPPGAPARTVPGDASRQ